MQQAIPYSSGRKWLPVATVNAGPASIIADRLSLDGPPSSAISGGNSSCSSGASSGSGSGGEIRSMVMENPEVVLGRRGCCMCHVVKRLLLGLGVNPTVCEVDEDREETALMEDLTGLIMALDGSRPRFQFPAVFIGGRLVGGLDRIMAAHISGDLIPTLKDAGALWL